MKTLHFKCSNLFTNIKRSHATLSIFHVFWRPNRKWNLLTSSHCIRAFIRVSGSSPPVRSHTRLIFKHQDKYNSDLKHKTFFTEVNISALRQHRMHAGRYVYNHYSCLAHSSASRSHDVSLICSTLHKGSLIYIVSTLRYNETMPDLAELSTWQTRHLSALNSPGPYAYLTYWLSPPLYIGYSGGGGGRLPTVFPKTPRRWSQDQCNYGLFWRERWRWSVCTEDKTVIYDTRTAGPVDREHVLFNKNRIMFSEWHHVFLKHSVWGKTPPCRGQ